MSKQRNKIQDKYCNKYQKNINDNYKGSGYLINKLYEEFDESFFTKYIIKFFKTVDAAFKYEAYIVNDNTLKDNLCLNLIKGGKNYESTIGKILIHKNLKEIYIEPNELKTYLNLGWKKGKSLKNIFIWMHNDFKSIHVPMYDKEIYENNGYKLHKRKEDIYTYINNGVEEKYIQKIKLYEYLSLGWKKGKINKNTKKEIIKYSNRIRIVKDNKCKYVKLEDLNNYLNDGWKLNKHITLDNKNYKDKIYLYKDNKEIHINSEYLETYLKNGWVRGRLIDLKKENNPAYGKTWIYKNNDRKYVDLNDLNKYIENGWSQGFIRNNENYGGDVWINNGIKNTKVKSNKLDEYLKIMKNRYGEEHVFLVSVLNEVEE